jgi:hypothetical protein
LRFQRRRAEVKAGGYGPGTRGRAWLAVAALAAAVLAPVAGAAAEESGIPLGPLVVKPSLAVDLAFDSNVYRDPSTSSPEGDLGLQLVPAIALVYPGENFRWQLDGSYRFFTYFNVGGNNHDDLRVLNNFRLATLFDINRKGKIGLFLNPELYNRPASRGPGDSTDYEAGASVPLRLVLRPTSAFSVVPAFRWAWQHSYFPETPFDLTPFVLGDRHEIAGGLGVDWRFFPRSHLLLDGEVGHVFWSQNTETVAATPPVPADFWRVWFGLKGDLTRKLSLLARIGYGNVYLGEAARDQNFSGIKGLLGEVELAVRPVQTQRLGVGFRRDFKFQWFANHVSDTQVYFKYNGLFFGRLGANADVSYTYRELVGSVTRNEHQIAAGLGVDVAIVDWFRVGGGYRFSAIPVTNTGTGEYIDHRVTFGIVLGYK